MITSMMDLEHERGVGDYMVWYMPFGDYASASWQKAFWDGSLWYVYSSTLIKEEYVITHWAYLPEKPPLKQCEYVTGLKGV